MKPWLAIVNPAAGGGRCGSLAQPAVSGLRQRGIQIDVVFTQEAGGAVRLAREGYESGYRQFVAVGGDGTSFEVVNGLFPGEPGRERPALGFLPLGTGNSFLRDFSSEGLEYASAAILSGRSRPCDVLQLTHREGVVYYINLVSVGFTAEAGELANRRFKRLGEAGYLLAILICWMKLRFPVFPLKLDGSAESDDRPCVYLTFSNSRFTGGNLMIAPQAETADGFVEVTRVGVLPRWNFARTFPKIFSGRHMEHPMISRTAARRIDFQLSEPIDIMVDGEVMRCHPERIEVLPSALEIVV